MKLTRLLTLSTAVLALLVCGMLAHITRDAWRRYDATSAGLQALRLTQSAMVAAEKLSFERGPVNAVLGDRIPVDPARRDRLQHGRAATDLALLQLERALQSASSQGQAGASITTMATLSSLSSQLAAARATVDQLAALPPANRTPEKMKATLGRMFALVPLALDTVTGYTQSSEHAYPRISRPLIKARYAVELREYAGRMGSVLTVALAARQPLTTEEHEQLQLLRGRIAQLRQQIQARGGDDDLQPSLAAVVTRMDQIHFGTGQQLVADVERDSRAGRPYGMDTAQFAQRYVPTMTPILALRDELLRQAQLQAQSDHEHARTDLWIVILSGAAILLALTLLLLIVRRRVVVPLLRATRAVIRIGAGDYSRDPGGSQRNDEIGDMLRALSTLRTNSIERQQLEIERQRLIEELRLRANTDYLTGILNRRAFTSAGNKRLHAAQAQNETLAVLLFDIDHFKSVNDSHGHEAGDQVLIRVAALVRAELRDSEILARHGGEEFVVMPAHCTLEQACVLAERLRTAIEREPLTLADGHILRVTASFGVASASGPAAALDSLLHAADLALYRAKRKGRNRVESAS
ncbi:MULTISPECIES: diguanylate cyclase [unclassified Duganella]|uniref:GGDEF domain-containing protein n=1 Tax=unclassified Duganella TaxID=2636909 RepID=UPI000886481B|nr:MULTISPECIES: sensor domain-containing diguanylate cyclase [unclassified Duganella]SDH59136.1 diguanylate cyclase (GGDEF) domain-containing protein [Duganella sp. OV458]SDJ44119.1 diguanylate cyclase (GGDEF) domain-containing protein [Duganella sp. OV510]